jgi:hypothetical protein
MGAEGEPAQLGGREGARASGVRRNTTEQLKRMRISCGAARL